MWGFFTILSEGSKPFCKPFEFVVQLGSCITDVFRDSLIRISLGELILYRPDVIDQLLLCVGGKSLLVPLHVVEQIRNAHPATEHIAHRAWHVKVVLGYLPIGLQNLFTGKSSLVLNHVAAHYVDQALRLGANCAKVNGRAILLVRVLLE